ncbi:MAG: helix-turn-helix domain-containing protein [Collinsella intestinalis]
MAVYLANNLCEMTTPAIGAEFGGRDHSTVLNSLKVVENKMREDRRIVEDIQNLKNTILLKS